MTANQLMSQAEARMERAEEAGDMDAWITHYKIWIELVPTRIREGTLNRLANRVHREERDGEANQSDFETLPFFHPAVG